MTDDPRIPGFRVVHGARTAPEDGLRNDVAGFLGPTARGPVGVPVRVEGRRAYGAVFGGALTGAATPRAVEAYFANDGRVAWVLRTGRGGAPATGSIELGGVTAGAWDAGGPARLTLPGNRIEVRATSPGAWAEGTVVRVTYRAFGMTGAPELDVRVEVPGEPRTQRVGLAPRELPGALAEGGLLEAAFAGDAVTGVPAGATGPAGALWSATLSGGADPRPDRDDYMDAAESQAQIGEIALVCAPDLGVELDATGHDAVVAALAAAAAAAQDRLVVVDCPTTEPATLAAWRSRIDAVVADPRVRRAVAAYGPWLVAEDPSRPPGDRYVATNPVGHVCGTVSRLDRERGSGWAPANALVRDAIDVVRGGDEAEQVLALGGRVNLLRCRPGGGIEIWGASTLDAGEGRQIAHRRLIHRIVRAIRRVAEPLAFDANVPILWFTVARAVSGVLLEAHRSGFLQGETPAQAFRVTCDETTNTPDRIDAGEVVCEIEVAPAAPMEFITLRLTLGAQGLLEVVER